MRRLLALTVLVACATPDDLGPEVAVDGLAGPPGVPALKASVVPLGDRQVLEIESVYAGETVYVARSAAGAGSGSCPTFLGGACFGLLDPVVLHTQGKANDSGYAQLKPSVSDRAAWSGQTWCFQGAVLRGGVAVLGNVVCRPVGYDADGDLVLDASDACPGHDDFYDWDRDGTADGCDAGSPLPATYSEAKYPTAVITRSIQGRTVRAVLPVGAPVAVVFAFHGAGGDGGFLVDSPEAVHAFTELLSRGYAVVTLDSENRGAGTWDDATGPSTNKDWKRLSDLRTALIGAGVIDGATPVVAWGFSGGGGFAAYVGHVAPGKGWPLAAISLHSSGGFSSYGGASPLVPTAFLPAENDDVVPPSNMRPRYDALVGASVPAAWILQAEQRLAPTRFARSSFIEGWKSEELFKQLVEDGRFDKGGYKLFSDANIDSVIDAVGNDPEYYPNKPAKSVLNAVLATHAIIGDFVEAEADFLDAQL